MTRVQPSWWHRPLWPWSRLTPWQGFVLSAPLSALVAYEGNRLFTGEQTVLIWLVWV